MSRSILKTALDRFAEAFLRYLEDTALSDSLYIQHGEQLAKYLSGMRPVKVLHCSTRFWKEWVLPLMARSARGSPREYTADYPREDADGASFPPIGVDAKTGERYWVNGDKRLREHWLKTILPAQLIHDFENCNAFIFLYRPERWAQKATREKYAPGMARYEWEKLKTLHVQLAAYRVTAHECLHLIEQVAGWQMPSWNPADPTSNDPAERSFHAFLADLTLPVFTSKYLRKTQADTVDLP
jgi:hypothetical protein